MVHWDKILDSSKDRSQSRVKARRGRARPRHGEGRAQPGVWPLQSQAIHGYPMISGVQQNAKPIGMQSAEDLVKDDVALEVALFPQCTDEENNSNEVAPQQKRVEPPARHRRPRPSGKIAVFMA